MKTSVIIPNWNGKELIANTLDALGKQTKSHEVIVVDNGSQDDSAAYIRHKYPRVAVLELPTNRGFAGGVNVGIKYAIEAGAMCVALLNNDAVPDKNWLEELVVSIKKTHQTGIVTSKMLHMEGKHIDSTGEFYSIWGMPFPRGRNEFDNGQYDDQVEIFGASGGASLYRTALFKDIGLFDEDFFAYFEDVDISFRAQLAGWQVIYEPKAIAYHRLSATSSRLGREFSYYHTIKNFLLLYDRNMPMSLYWKYLPSFGYQFARMFAGSIKHGLFVTFLRAVLKVLWLTPKTLRLRLNRRKSRRVSAKQIEQLLYRGKPPIPPALEANRG